MTMNNTIDIAYVHIEIKRIQTYLFSVPKLKAMLGANTILGETLMGSIEDLDESSTASGNLVCLARNYSLQPVVVPDFIKSSLEVDSEVDSEYADDNPLAFAEKGIISRNGGHFSACFTSKKEALNFISAARALIAEKLPGSLVQATVFTKKQIIEEMEGEKILSTHASALAELPQFMSCSGSGNDSAAETSHDQKPVSRSYYDKILAADNFYEGKTRDAVTKLLGAHHKNSNESKDQNSFEDMCGDDYLAVIHADGNCMGELSKEFLDRKRKEYQESDLYEKFFQDELLRESFYFSMRRCVRKALTSSLESIFHINNNEKTLITSFRILMLGGDDLMLVCKASYAFPFIIEYAKQIKFFADKYGIELSVGAGIVIANKKYPFNRMHKLAEDLASRAKQMRMYQLRKRVSVVDWFISTESLLDTLSSINTRHWHYSLDDYSYYLTLRPYRIIGEGLTLENLYTISTMLLADEIPRNQYKRFVAKLQNGLISSCVSFAELPESLKNIFIELKKLLSEKGEKNSRDISWYPFIKFKNGNSYYTNIPDLIELAEISYLPTGGKQTLEETEDEINGKI